LLGGRVFWPDQESGEPGDHAAPPHSITHLTRFSGVVGTSWLCHPATELEGQLRVCAVEGGAFQWV
jgi:hypothetical protein